jgi:Protein of unknown function (DUF2946)
VPDCRGWLGLDGRGNWYMRDDRCQRAGPFAPQPGESVATDKGSLLRHDKLIAFIGRNYLSDGQGQWYFQNGPQRVYVELEHTPWVWRLQPDGTLHTHTGVPAGPVTRSLLDDEGHLYLVTALGLGLVHTSDMGMAADRVEQGEWTPEPVDAKALPAQWGFVRSPQRESEKKPVG